MVSSILLVAAITLQGAPQAPAPVSTEALSQAYMQFLTGLALESRGDSPGAIAAYRRALELAPRAAEVHAELAALFAREGRATQAIAEAEQALKLDGENREAHRILGFVQAALVDNASDAGAPSAELLQAIDHLERAVAVGVVDPGAELTLGRLYVRNAQYSKAVEILRHVLLEQPDEAEAALLLADAFERRNEPSEAIDVLKNLTSSDPADVPGRSRLAELYERLGRWKDAAVLWDELGRLNPREIAYRTRHATAVVNGGDLIAGRRELIDLTKDSPRDLSVWYLLSQVERRAGNPEAAEQAAQRIAEIDPKDPRGPLSLAEAKAARRDFRGVVDTLSPIVSAARDEDVASGTYARMVGELAAALQEVGDRGRAVRLLEDAQRRDPNDVDLLFNLGTAYERDQRFDLAEQAFRRVIAKDPSNAEALNYLGYMLADRGQKLDEAVDLVKRALAIESDNPSYLDSLGWAYVKQTRLEQAREPLERAAAALPKTSVILDHLAELYFQMKRYADAAGTWDRALAGDREGIDVSTVTKKRDRAKELSGK